MDARDFRVERAADERAVILSVFGDADIFTAPALKEALLEAIDEGRERVLIDLSEVSFVDSTGLGVLVSGAKKAKRGTLAVICPDEAKRLIFKVVGFDRLFMMYDSLADALASSAAAGASPPA